MGTKVGVFKAMVHRVVLHQGFFRTEMKHRVIGQLIEHGQQFIPAGAVGLQARQSIHQMYQLLMLGINFGDPGFKLGVPDKKVRS